MEKGEYLLSIMDKILSWNVRGLNHKEKCFSVRELIEKQDIGLLGLLETRIKAHKMGTLYLSMFSNWCFTNNIPWHPGGRIVIA